MKSQLLVRRPDGDFEDELAVYDQIDVIPRFVDVGSWSVKTPASPLALQLAQPGWGISYRRGDRTIISGPQTLGESKFDAATNSVILSGLSDLVTIADKLVYPSAFPFTADDYDDQEGPAETIIKHYIGVVFNDMSRIAGAPLTVAPDQARGLVVAEHGRLQNLIEFLQGIALVGGNLGFDMIDNEFEVYVPQDRSAEQVFSVESGSVSNIQTKVTAPTATRVLVGGGGEGTSRIFTRQNDFTAEAYWKRVIEIFVDARDTTDTTVLDKRGYETLLKGAAKTEITVTPRDVPHRTFIEDWYLGDTVSDGRDVSGVIKEVHLTVDMNGELIQPKVSSANSSTATETLRAYDAIRKLNTRMLNIERSQ